MKQKKTSLDDESKITTSICFEQESPDNPYVAEDLLLAGYSLSEIVEKATFSDVLFLLFTGDVAPSAEDKDLLNALLIQLSLPGPRHPAARTAMNSGVCKANAEHLLPISLLSLGGNRMGAREVEACYRFIDDNIGTSIEEILSKFSENRKGFSIPGFGKLYGEVDPVIKKFLSQLLNKKSKSETLTWVQKLSTSLNQRGVGLLDVGLAAAVFRELGFGARESVGLYQLIRAPGLLAYSMEQTHKPVSAIPFLKDSDYELVSE